MCPYFETRGDYCAIYGTKQDGYTEDHFCWSSGYWRDCPNYKQLCSVYNGNPPPPSHYK